MTEASPTPRGRRQRYVLACLAILVLTGLRVVALGADTPRELSGWSLGVFVDEGYKSLDARNLALFGESKWHPEDDYAGWIGRSPMVVAAYHGSFELFGVRLESVRLVSVLCFGVLCLGYLGIQRKRYPVGLLLVGLFFLGLQQTLYFFSRIALFEFPLLVCLYMVLFLLSRPDRTPTLWTALSVGALFCLATFGIKTTAPLYFIPVACGLFVSYLVQEERRSRVRAILVPAVVLLALLVWTVWSIRHEMLARFGPQQERFGRSFLWNQAMYSAAPLVTLGLFCAFHALLVEPRRYLGHPYRAGLICLILLGIPMITLQEYRPLRYYVPFLPAFALLPIEWLHLGTWRVRPPARIGWKALTGVGLVLTWCFCSLGLMLLWNVFFAVFSPVTAVARVLTPSFLAALALLATVILLWRGRDLLSGKPVLVAVVLLMVGGTVRDADRMRRFLTAPSFRVREISRDLERILPEEASIGGTWAPVLTIDTRLRSLYMNMLINRPSRIQLLRPDYLVVVGKSEYYRQMVRRRDVHVGDSIYQSHYAGQKISLYPMSYLDPSTLPKRRRRAGGGPGRDESNRSRSSSAGV